MNLATNHIITSHDVKWLEWHGRALHDGVEHIVDGPQVLRTADAADSTPSQSLSQEDSEPERSESGIPMADSFDESEIEENVSA